MSKCIVCHEKEATVPDRYSMSRRKSLCSGCHAKRLMEDLKRLVPKKNPVIKTEIGQLGEAQG